MTGTASEEPKATSEQATRGSTMAPGDEGEATEPQPAVRMDFALVLGADIRRADELDPADPEVRSALMGAPFDGALIIEVDEIEFLDENLWDRLNIVLCDLVKILRRLEAGRPKASLVFPDTRASLRFEVTPDGGLDLSYEDRSALEMIGRFVDLVRAATATIPPACLPLAAFIPTSKPE